MKKLVLVFFYINFMTSVFSQNAGKILEHGEEGKQYVKCRIATSDRTEFQEAQVLKVIPSQWETSIDTFYRDSVEFVGEQVFRVKIKDGDSKWVHKKDLDRNCLSANPKNCIGFTKVEVPPQYRTVRFRENEDFVVLKTKHLQASTSIEIVELPFPELKKGESTQSYKDGNEVLYIKMQEGYWTDWREILCGCGGRGTRGNTISEVQEALFQAGYYDGEIDNVLGNELKAALVKFQKDRGLPVGQLDLETLRALGFR